MAAPDLEARPVPTEMITVGDQRIRVAVRHGDGPQNPFLLMNGLGVSLEALQPFVDVLDPTRTVIRFDVPGVGKSPPPALPYRFRGVAKLASAMLDTLGVGAVDVLGVSWGGGLAQQFAFQDRRCQHLVLVSTTSGVTIPGSLAVVGEMFSMKRFTDLDHAKKVGPRIYGGKLRADLGGSVKILQHVRPSVRGHIFQQLAVLGWTSIPFAQRIRQPTLILTGDDDPIIAPVNATILRTIIPNARVHRFHDGHLGLITSAAELGPIVEAFLDGTTASV